MDREELMKVLDTIEIDYSDPGLPSAVRNLKPIVYKDGDGICVMEGETPMDGAFGCGKTEKEAMKDFQRHYEEQKNSFKHL